MEQQQVSRTIVRKIQTLAEIAAEWRQGKSFKVTRLTLLKNLCNRREAATKFAVHLTELTLKKMQERECPSHITSENWEQYLQQAAKAAHEMTEHVNQGMTEEPWALHALRTEIRNAQSQYERQAWGPVRIIHSRELLFVETALECVLQPRAFKILAYDLTRQYCERRDARYGTGLLPEREPPTSHHRHRPPQPSLEDIPRVEDLTISPVETLFMHSNFVSQLPAALFDNQHVIQRREGFDLRLLVAGPLEGHDGGLLGIGSIKDQADRTGLDVELGHVRFPFLVAGGCGRRRKGHQHNGKNKHGGADQQNVNHRTTFLPG